MKIHSVLDGDTNFATYVRSHINVMELQHKNSSSIQLACEEILKALTGGSKIMFVGNGGSASDAQHLAAELVGRFRLNRTPLAAIALNTDTSIITACANDFGYEQVFSRQFEAIAREGDVLFLISTSGESPSILKALRLANSRGFITIGLTGSSNSTLAREAKVTIAVGNFETCFVQEAHIVIGQFICHEIETRLFGS